MEDRNETLSGNIEIPSENNSISNSSSEISKDQLKSYSNVSESSEFTYFSLGLNAAENNDTDDISKYENEKIDQITANSDSYNNINEFKKNLKKSFILEDIKISKQSSESIITSVNLNLKKTSIDYIIDQLRNNQIDNKEVCNYVLNMLVDGEFDLEKNFVIKNYTNILLMVQVIKCANSNLKAELWSLFTALLRKSYLNLQACVDIGLIETVLQELETADYICGDLIIELLTVLANYNINVEELKIMFNWLKGENHFWVG